MGSAQKNDTVKIRRTTELKSETIILSQKRVECNKNKNKDQ